MGDENEETAEIERGDGAVVADVSPEDILGALDDSPADADTVKGESEQAAEEELTGEKFEDGDAAEAQETPETKEEPPTDQTVTQTDDQELVAATILHQGREVTVMVPPDAAQAIEAQRITAAQLAPLQAKHLQVLEELRAGTRPAQGDQAQPGETPQVVNPEEFIATMKPRVEEVIKAGHLEQDAFEDFPIAASNMVYAFDKVQQLETTVGQIANLLSGAMRNTEIDDFKSSVFGVMNDLAEANPQVYGDLAEPEKRGVFYDYVVDMNPTIGQLSGEECPKTLTALYDAYKGEELRAAALAASTQAKAEQEDARLRAGGAGGGGGGRAQPKSKHPDIDDVLSGD